MNSPHWAVRSTVRPARPLHSATRYLCAAAYLDAGFRKRVTEELLSDPHRAVAPSHGGFDAGPVIGHCLRARTMLAMRDLLLVVVITFGLIVDLGRMLSWLVVVGTMAMLITQVRTQSPKQRLAARAGLVTIVVTGIVLLFYISMLSSLVQYSMTGEAPPPGGTGLGWILVLATLVIAVGYRVSIGVLLSRELRPGATAPGAVDATSSTASRAAYIDTAQWSDLTLYSGENPFVGAGTITKAWSIAVELDRPKSARPRETPLIDPLKLYDFVGARLVEMRDRVARPAESLDIQISDHVIARGLVNRLSFPGGTHPLIDPATGLPVHRLGEEAIRAIIRQPKAGLRYYQRITLGTSAEEIRDENDRLVMPAEDQEIVVSAFVYLAIEGRMLYTEFIVTVLPPVADAYHLVDRLPRDGLVRIALTSLAVLRGQLLRDLAFAPLRLAALVFDAAIDAVRPPRRPDDFILYDYGARASVRELGAGQGELTYLQQLDSSRYTKLIGERLNAAVLDFLEKHDIDTSAYRQQAAAIVNNGTMISGGTFSGATTVGAQATVNVTTPSAPSNAS